MSFEEVPRFYSLALTTLAFFSSGAFQPLPRYLLSFSLASRLGDLKLTTG